MQHRLHHGEFIEIGIEKALNNAGHGCLFAAPKPGGLFMAV